jgi:hypothetical protein
MAQPLNPPINIYLQPGETIGHALMRVALIARERRTTGIPFLDADGADISIRDTPLYTRTRDHHP